MNGKNTGAIAEYEISSAEDIIQKVLSVLLQQIYTKPQINNILNNYISKVEFKDAVKVNNYDNVQIFNKDNNRKVNIMLKQPNATTLGTQQ